MFLFFVLLRPVKDAFTTYISLLENEQQNDPVSTGPEISVSKENKQDTQFDISSTGYYYHETNSNCCCCCCNKQWTTREWIESKSRSGLHAPDPSNSFCNSVGRSAIHAPLNSLLSSSRPIDPTKKIKPYRMCKGTGNGRKQ